MQHIGHRRQGALNWTLQAKVLIAVVDNLLVVATLLEPDYTWLWATCNKVLGDIKIENRQQNI